MTAASQLESNQLGADFGISVSGAGDVNNDGFDDVIVGAHLYDGNLGNEGAAFVFLGSGSGIPDSNPSTAALSFETDQVDAAFGWRVAGAGDVNDDGLDDLIVGVDADQSEEGAAFVYLVTSIAAVPSLSPPGRALLGCLLLGMALFMFSRAIRRERSTS